MAKAIILACCSIIFSTAFVLTCVFLGWCVNLAFGALLLPGFAIARLFAHSTGNAARQPSPAVALAVDVAIYGLGIFFLVSVAFLYNIRRKSLHAHSNGSGR